MNLRSWHSKLTLREIRKAKGGMRFESGVFSIRFSAYSKPSSVFLLVASKKRVDKRAVLRNRVKRRLRAALDTLVFRIPVCATVVIYKEVLNVRFATLISELQSKYLLFCNKLHAARNKQSTANKP